MGVHDGARYAPLSAAAYDTNAKVNPPLRERSDMEAMIEGLADGTIDLIATDHAPHGQTEKLTTFEEAAMGISNIETAFGSAMQLVHAGLVELPLIIEKLTAAPAAFLARPDIGNAAAGRNRRRRNLRSQRRVGSRCGVVHIQGQKLAAGRAEVEGAG